MAVPWMLLDAVECAGRADGHAVHTAVRVDHAIGHAEDSSRWHWNPLPSGRFGGPGCSGRATFGV